eukprot:scaffold29143_cov56-Phaeocystis_antarctica.AAC.2
MPAAMTPAKGAGAFARHTTQTVQAKGMQVAKSSSRRYKGGLATSGTAGDQGHLPGAVTAAAGISMSEKSQPMARVLLGATVCALIATHRVHALQPPILALGRAEVGRLAEVGRWRRGLDEEGSRKGPQRRIFFLPTPPTPKGRCPRCCSTAA